MTESLREELRQEKVGSNILVNFYQADCTVGRIVCFNDFVYTSQAKLQVIITLADLVNVRSTFLLQIII